MVIPREAIIPRRERNIYKRKDGRYEARFIKERGAGGKAKYGAVYARTYAEVKVKLKQHHISSNLPRHTFATRDLEKGFDIKTLSEIVTLKKYAHVLDEHKRRSMELLEELYR